LRGPLKEKLLRKERKRRREDQKSRRMLARLPFGLKSLKHDVQNSYRTESRTFSAYLEAKEEQNTNITQEQKHGRKLCHSLVSNIATQ
jgi:hypothetical protein